MAKYIATTKGANLQKRDATAHGLLVKWSKFQLGYKKRIKHFLPRIDDHPPVTLHGAITEWGPSSRARNDGEDVEVPVHFPPAIVSKYQSANEVYIPSAPVKKEKANLILKTVPLDVRFLLRCGLKWDNNDIQEEDASASRGPAPAAAPTVDTTEADRSPSSSPVPDPLNFTA